MLLIIHLLVVAIFRFCDKTRDPWTDFISEYSSLVQPLLKVMVRVVAPAHPPCPPSLKLSLPPPHLLFPCTERRSYTSTFLLLERLRLPPAVPSFPSYAQPSQLIIMVCPLMRPPACLPVVINILCAILADRVKKNCRTCVVMVKAAAVLVVSDKADDSDVLLVSFELEQMLSEIPPCNHAPKVSYKQSAAKEPQLGKLL